MRRIAQLALCLALAVALAGVLAGCSGTGAPTEPRELTELRAIAADQVTSVTLVKRWLIVLHGEQTVSPAGAAAAGCARPWEPLPPEPGDPPGSARWQATMSDCTVVTTLTRADGSGWQRFVLADGRMKRMKWGIPRTDGHWEKTDFTVSHWDGSSMAYERGRDLSAPLWDSFRRGTATLPDARTLGFAHDRNLRLDRVALSPDDGSYLEVQVPLTDAAGAPYWPVFVQGAAGSYRNPDGQRSTFAFTGSGTSRWDTWRLTAGDGTRGRFALSDGMAGAGQLERDGAAVAWLSWDASGVGSLQPVGASAVAVTPSAAARDFTIDTWIGNIANLGPMPSY